MTEVPNEGRSASPQTQISVSVSRRHLTACVKLVSDAHLLCGTGVWAGLYAVCLLQVFVQCQFIAEKSSQGETLDQSSTFFHWVLKLQSYRMLVSLYYLNITVF